MVVCDIHASDDVLYLEGLLNRPEAPQANILCQYFLLAIFKKYFKGSVSRKLRPMLLYIIGKLFSRPIVASLKIFILLKGQFAMYIKPFSVS